MGSSPIGACDQDRLDGKTAGSLDGHHDDSVDSEVPVRDPCAWLRPRAAALHRVPRAVRVLDSQCWPKRRVPGPLSTQPRPQAIGKFKLYAWESIDGVPIIGLEPHWRL